MNDTSRPRRRSNDAPQYEQPRLELPLPPPPSRRRAAERAAEPDADRGVWILDVL